MQLDGMACGFWLNLFEFWISISEDFAAASVSALRTQELNDSDPRHVDIPLGARPAAAVHALRWWFLLPGHHGGGAHEMEFVLQRDAGANSGVPNSGVATSAGSAASSRGSGTP